MRRKRAPNRWAAGAEVFFTMGATRSFEATTQLSGDIGAGDTFSPAAPGSPIARRMASIFFARETCIAGNPKVTRGCANAAGGSTSALWIGRRTL